MNCAFSYTGNMEPSLVCTPGSDELVELTYATTQSVMYRKKILKWTGEMLHINCCISVPNIAGSIHVWTSHLVIRGEIYILFRSIIVMLTDELRFEVQGLSHNPMGDVNPQKVVITFRFPPGRCP